VVGDNQQQGAWEEVGQVEGEGGELPQGDLLNGLSFECVVSVWEICHGDPISCNDIYVGEFKYIG
jgi:hypothetical protein